CFDPAGTLDASAARVIARTGINGITKRPTRISVLRIEDILPHRQSQLCLACLTGERIHYAIRQTPAQVLLASAIETKPDRSRNSHNKSWKVAMTKAADLVESV